jgi:hypothetical protein
MAVYTLAQLRAQVRSAADAENDGHKSDSDIATWINQGAQELHDKIVAGNEDYHTTAVEFTLTAATGNTFALPENLQCIRGLDIQDGSRWCKVEEYSFAERNAYDEAYFDGTYRLWYVLRYTNLVADADELDDHLSEYAVSFAARKARMKEEGETREFEADMARLAARAMTMFAKRSRGSRRVIADVRGRGRQADNNLWAESFDSRLRAYRVFQNAVFVVGRSLF